jgi:hypothetical protein
MIWNIKLTRAGQLLSSRRIATSCSSSLMAAARRGLTPRVTWTAGTSTGTSAATAGPAPGRIERHGDSGYLG